ncbi:hypothetical protein WMF31_32385 [Sorangium sp. So ce1036]
MRPWREDLRVSKEHIEAGRVTAVIERRHSPGEAAEAARRVAGVTRRGRP